MNHYEMKQEARRERLERAAARAKRRSDAAYNTSRAILDPIPLGQPILVGHHSEKRHRRALERADNAMRRALEESKRAHELEARAAAVGTAGISSDDPEALDKIKARIVELQEKHARMVLANKLFRRGDAAGLAELGFDLEKLRAEMPQRYSWERSGPFVSYQLQNSSANIRRLLERVKELEYRRQVAANAPLWVDADGNDHYGPEPKVLAGGVRLEQDIEGNRTRLFFPAKPPEAVRKSLKSHGFRWSPTEGAWQRHYQESASSAYLALGYRYDSEAREWRAPAEGQV